MAYETVFLEEHNTILYHLIDQVDVDTLKACRADAKSYEPDQARYHILLVFDANAKVSLPHQDLVNFLAFTAGHRVGVKRVIVATKDVDYGVSRMFVSMCNDPDDGFCITRSIEEASAHVPAPLEVLIRALAMTTRTRESNA